MEKDNHPKVQDSINKVEQVLQQHYQSSSRVQKPTGPGPVKPLQPTFPQPQPQPPVQPSPVQRPAPVTPKQPIKPIGNYTPKPMTQPIPVTPKATQPPAAQTPQNKTGKSAVLDGFVSFVAGKEEEVPPYAKPLAENEKKEIPEEKSEGAN